MIDIAQLERLIAGGESLTCDFKSDRKQLSDNTIYEEIVAFANADGGVLLLGVEDNGIISGAHSRHGTYTDPMKMQSAIFNNTVPNINTRISIVQHPTRRRNCHRGRCIS